MQDFYLEHETPPGAYISMRFCGGPLDGGFQVIAAPGHGDYMQCEVSGGSGRYVSDVPWTGQEGLVMRYCEGVL